MTVEDTSLEPRAYIANGNQHPSHILGNAEAGRVLDGYFKMPSGCFAFRGS